MKKSVGFILVAALVLISSVLMCAVRSGKNDKALPINPNVQIEVSVDGSCDSMKINVTNYDDTPIICGLDYNIEVFKNNKWRFYRDCGPYDALGIEIQPGGQYVQSVNISGINAIAPGTYRIVKPSCVKPDVSNEFAAYSEGFVIK